MAHMKAVIDKNGVRYELDRLLGQGGQGSVYSIKGGRLAVKIVLGGSRPKRDRLRSQLTFVKRLPLRELALAKPLEMLRPPYTGYVMELLTDMVPIKTLANPSKGQSPSVEWYLGGGGLRRRLLLLGNAAQILSQIHGKGLVYSDPSPDNIFISSVLDGQEVRLIDTDNLQYESDSSKAVYTPGYGAPELVNGISGASTLTDSYSMAIIAFQVLTLAHPFIGDLVNDGEPELEEQAFAGRLPWIDDPEDDSNRAGFGVPRDWVLSPKLFEIFAQAFGPGRLAPTKRPGTSTLADKLYSAADATVQCSDCSGTYYFNQSECPWCDAPRPTLVTTVFRIWDPGLGPEGDILTRPKGERKVPVLAGHAAAADDSSITITRRLAFGASSGRINEPVLSIAIRGNKVKIRSLDGMTYKIISPTGNQQSEVGDQEKELTIKERQESWRVHFGPSDTLHRVASFELRKGGLS